eukprot:GHVN01034418.1.p1 GENE.GHVN01034418.1~~GHVN01034418.1.p1  ORF type:complete len:2066 (-),score=313.54 GHVN01034418.1:3181-8721(-)
MADDGSSFVKEGNIAVLPTPTADDNSEVSSCGVMYAMVANMRALFIQMVILPSCRKEGQRLMCMLCTLSTPPPKLNDELRRVVIERRQKLIADEDNDEAANFKICLAAVDKSRSEAFASKSPISFRSLAIGQCIRSGADPDNAELTSKLLEMGKLLILHDVILRELPLELRAHAASGRNPLAIEELGNPNPEEETGSPYLDFFFGAASHCFRNAQSMVESQLDALQVDVKSIVDFFDAQLFHTCLLYFLERSKAAGWTVSVKDTGSFMNENTLAAVHFIWQDVCGQSNSFWPIQLSELFDHLEDLEFGDVEVEQLGEPELERVQFQLLQQVLKTPAAFEVGFLPGFKLVDRLNEPEVEVPSVEFDPYNVAMSMIGNQLDSKPFKPTRKFDSTAHRHQIERKKKNQMEQRGKNTFHNYAKSLAGADKLYAPVIVTERHVWRIAEAEDTLNKRGINKKDNKKDKKADKESAKEQSLRKANEVVIMKQKAEKDQNQLHPLMADVAHLTAHQASDDLTQFNKELLDITTGYDRVVDSLEDCRNITKKISIPTNVVSILVAIASACHFVLSPRRPDYTKIQYRRTLFTAATYAFNIVGLIVKKYGVHVTGEEVQTLQRVLIDLGFPNSANNMFAIWKRMKLEAAASVEGEAETTAKPKKKGKDKGNACAPSSSASKDAAENLALEEFKVEGIAKEGAIGTYEGGEARFQLKWMSKDMDRKTGAVPDTRVLFSPDAWQKKLLDIVDQRESALTIAPTASGKTFICFYAMDQVLRYDNTRTVIYVAPSKALVNQVEADIYARFSTKAYPNTSTQLSAKLFEEVNTRHLDCQVLVTTPYFLETLLMALSEKNTDWYSRLAYVILDEIHCIGAEGEGVYWENVVHLMPCPFLALSATVGNPNSFHSWLQRVKQACKSDVHVVVHRERYSDLSFMAYTSSTDPSTKEGSIYPLNPAAHIRHDQILDTGFAPDFYLTPVDAMKLWNCMANELGSDHELVQYLDPEYFFGGAMAVDKRMYHYYVNSFKQSFLMALRSGLISKTVFDRIVNNLKQVYPIDRYMQEMTPENLARNAKLQQALQGEKAEGSVAAIDMSDLASTSAESCATASSVGAVMISSVMQPKGTYCSGEALFRFVRDLDERSMLPALVFNFSPDAVRLMAVQLISTLIKRHRDKFFGTEEKRKATDEENKRRLVEYKTKKAAYDRQKKEEETKANDPEKKKYKSKGGGGDSDGGGGGGGEWTKNKDKGKVDKADKMRQALPMPIEPLMMEEEFDAETNFRSNRVHSNHIEEIENQIEKLRYAKVDPILIEGIMRGIGHHHVALSKTYRRCVETLFRLGYLRVVFATNTLALGINMPCRTAVFAGDSPQLTPLMFRQMSGRAGRRGFDLEGGVVMWDVSINKVQRLFASPLPVITGQYPVTPTAVLRTCHYVTNFPESMNYDDRDPIYEGELNNSRQNSALHMTRGRRLVNRFMEPLSTVSEMNYTPTATQTTAMRLPIRYRFRYMIELLRRQGLIDTFGRSKGTFAVPLCLTKSDPANIALAGIMQTGLLDDMVQNYTPEMKADDPVLLELLNFLSFFLDKHRIPFSNVISYNLGVMDAHLKIPGLALPKSSRRGCSTSPFLTITKPEAMEHVHKYNQMALHLAIDACRSLVHTKAMTNEDYTLPTSNLYFDNSREKTDLQNDGLIAKLSKLKRSTKLRSPFAALSGKSDIDFSSPAQLCEEARRCADVDPSMIPLAECTFSPSAAYENKEGDLCELPDEGDGKRLMRNSYVVDFYIHGNMTQLAHFNRIPRELVWWLLKDFHVYLSILKETLTEDGKPHEKLKLCLQRLFDEIGKLMGKAAATKKLQQMSRSKKKS